MATEGSTGSTGGGPPNRFHVAHKPTVARATGNWAVVSNATGRIRSRHHSQANARISARRRGRAVRRTRARRGR
jgi:hypothetical protein